MLNLTIRKKICSLCCATLGYLRVQVSCKHVDCLLNIAYIIQNLLIFQRKTLTVLIYRHGIQPSH